MIYRAFVSILDCYLLGHLVLGTAIVNAWRVRRGASRPLWLVTLAWVGLWTMSTPAVSYLAFSTLERGYPPLIERPASVDAIVVLGGYLEPPNEMVPHPELGADTIYRCLTAARLYHQGQPCLIVVSGGKVNPDEPGPTIAKAMSDFLCSMGVQPANILLEERSRNTFENAVECRRLLQQRRIREVVLVSEAAHLARASRCFRAQELEVIPAGCQYRSARFEWSPSGFLPNPHAAIGLQEVIHEWLGLAWYAARGRI